MIFNNNRLLYTFKTWQESSNISYKITRIDKKHKQYLQSKSWKLWQHMYQRHFLLKKCINNYQTKMNKILKTNYFKIWRVTITSRVYVNYPLLMRRAIRMWYCLQQARLHYRKKVTRRCMKVWKHHIRNKYFNRLDAQRDWQLKMNATIK